MAAHILSGWRYRVDLVERAGTLNGMLVEGDDQLSAA